MSNTLSSIQSQDLIAILEERFKKNMHRHEGFEWTVVREKLAANQDKLWSLYRIEGSGGEPDVIAYDRQADEYRCKGLGSSI